MSEIINTIEIENPYVTIPMDRGLFYKEQINEFKKNKKPTKAVEVVCVFLFNENGQLILQKRSSNKNHNPDLIDKSIGGHITYGDSPDFTVMLESVQELKVPSIVLNSDADFRKTCNLLSNYTQTTSIVKRIGTELNINTPKIINDEEIVIANKTHIYIGIYEGSVKNIDNEAKGILFYTIDELEQELKKFPYIFTNDLHYYFKKYKDYFVKFNEEITSNPCFKKNK